MNVSFNYNIIINISYKGIINCEGQINMLILNQRYKIDNKLKQTTIAQHFHFDLLVKQKTV